MLDTSTSSTLAGRECEGDGERESVEGIGSSRERGIYDESERLRAGSAGHGSSVSGWLGGFTGGLDAALESGHDATSGDEDER